MANGWPYSNTIIGVDFLLEGSPKSQINCESMCPFKRKLMLKMVGQVVNWPLYLIDPNKTTKIYALSKSTFG